MRKLLLFVLLLPALADAQTKGKLSRAYVGVTYHESEIGGSIVNNFGINKYFGIGAGVDITTFDGKLLVPFYLDARGRYEINKWEPFILGQFGKNLYTKDLPQLTAGDKYQTKGKYFYGAGVGVTYHLGKVGIFASYTYRDYLYKSYTLNRDQNNTTVYSPFDLTSNANILSIGLVF